jgi:outer membrane protein TolC
VDEFVLTDTLSTAPFVMSLDSAKALALSVRPEVRSARLRVDANQSLVSSAWGGHLPTLSLFGTWTWSAFGFPLFSRWNAGVSLTVPIFQGFAVSGQVEEAEANADAAQASLDELNESVILEVEQNYLVVREAEERIAAAAKLVEQAEQNLNLSERQYAAGVGTALEATDAELSLSNARITYIQALFDYNGALVRLQRAIGAGQLD